MDNKYKIGQIGNFIGISKDTIRHWEKKGLLNIKKDLNNYSEFDDKNYYEIFKINLLRELGFSISEIKELNDAEEIDSKKALIENHINILDEEIKKLLFQREVLNETSKLPNSRELNLSTVKKTFKLKKIKNNYLSNFSILDTKSDTQIFITKFDDELKNDYDVYIEVSEDEDLMYEKNDFIHFFCPKEKVEDFKNLKTLVKEFANKNNLTLTGDVIELHDLKQTILSDINYYVEFYIAVESY